MPRTKTKRLARRLRHEIRVQQQVGTRTNSFGDQEIVWRDFATLRANVKPLASREFFYAQQAGADVTHLITCRPPPEGRIDPSMRIVWNDRRYQTERILEITGVVDVEERGRELEIRCLELY